MQYKSVVQEDEWGCGAACVASLLDISYQEAKRRLEDAKEAALDDEPKGLNYDPIAQVLHDYGITVIADWNAKKYPPGTIVLVYGKGNYKDGHYLLRVPNGWMNPWETLYDRRKKKCSSIKKSLPEGTRVKAALIATNG
jgi:hypothetical protein